MQWQAVTSGNVTMQIWLGKNMLGQSNTKESQMGIDTKRYGMHDKCPSDRELIKRLMKQKNF